MKSIYLLATAVAFESVLSGCGTAVPKIGEVWDRDYPGDFSSYPYTPPVSASGQIAFEIKKQIYCELYYAVRAADTYFVTDDRSGKSKNLPYIPDNWGAQISLSLEVDENTSINPGVGFITPFVSQQSRTLGFGGTLSSTATRTDKFNPYFSFAYLRSKAAPVQICNGRDPFIVDLHFDPAKSSFLTGNLGIKEWLLDAMWFNQGLSSGGAPGSSVSASPAAAASQSATDTDQGTSGKSKADGKKNPADSGGGSLKPDTVSIEIKFIVVSSGNFNPQWKLVRISADTGNTPLLSSGRTRTHDLIITVGPRGTQEFNNASLSLQIGQAVSAANRAALIGLSLSPAP